MLLLDVCGSLCCAINLYFINRMVSVDEMQFGFMPERGSIDAVFILRRMQEEYHAKGKKLYMFCGPRENF